MPRDEGRLPETPLGRKRGHCTSKIGDLAYLLQRITWPGGTVPELYHKPKTEMNQRGIKLRFGGRKLRSSDFAERDEVGLDRHAFGDFDVKKGPKGLEFASIGYGETQEKFLHGFFAAGVFDGALGAEGGGAGDDHDGSRGVESGDESHQGIILGEERARWSRARRQTRGSAKFLGGDLVFLQVSIG